LVKVTNAYATAIVQVFVLDDVDGIVFRDGVGKGYSCYWGEEGLRAVFFLVASC